MSILRRLCARLWRDPATRWPMLMLLIMLLLMLIVWLFGLDAPLGYRQPLPPPAANAVAV